MRSLWIVAVVLAISALVGCQAGIFASTDSSNAGGNGNGLKLNITQPVDESVVRSNPLTVTGNTQSDADVMINGISVAVENGHFSAAVELEPGPNSIDVSAADSSGKQSSKYLTVVYVP